MPVKSPTSMMIGTEPAPISQSCSRIFISCLGRKIFRTARETKMVEAPRLLTQLIALRPIAAKGSVSHRTGDRRASFAGLDSGVMSRFPFSRVVWRSEMLHPGNQTQEVYHKIQGQLKPPFPMPDPDLDPADLPSGT